MIKPCDRVIAPTLPPPLLLRRPRHGAATGEHLLSIPHRHARIFRTSCLHHRPGVAGPCSIHIELL